MPPCRRIETSINKNLIGKEDALNGVRAKFNLDAIQRGSFKDRMDGFAKMLGAGGHTPFAEVNEIRELADMNPVPWGDGKPEPARLPAVPPTDPDDTPKE